jgi:hypothetical protein
MRDDLVARGNVRRTLANHSGTLADTSTADIAQLKATWWQGAIPSYLQWSDDVGAIETAYTLATTGNVLQRTTGVKNAGVTYANEVAAAILAFENGSVTAQSQYFESLLSIQETAAEKRFKATRDQEIALADADLQKQLTATKRLITRPLLKSTQRTSQRSHQPSPLALRHSRPLPHSEQPHLLKSRKPKTRRSQVPSARTINLWQRSMRSTAPHLPTATPVSKVLAAMLRSPRATRSTTLRAILLGPVHLTVQRP